MLHGNPTGNVFAGVAPHYWRLAVLDMQHRCNGCCNSGLVAVNKHVDHSLNRNASGVANGAG